ncbi:MAG: TetR/AcrR family transcriptional regulator [Oscillospiraceae bacterium]|nr:TetR/AcrR family transcriptional regulator [Oscillospiraceae bacterium]
MNKNKERSEATRRKILDAFYELYKENGMKTTIGAISKKAGINRSTIYEHFVDIYDILDSYENELIKNIKSRFAQAMDSQFIIDFMDSLPIRLDILDEYEDNVFFLLSDKGDPTFRAKFRSAYISVVAEFTDISVNIPNFDYVMEFAFSAVIGMFERWYSLGKPIAPQEFMMMAQNLVINGIAGQTNI